ncbi:hypothetical protein COV93_06045 [Candidatus Woesearchaeota archaeon CG11_big_fil_rev_8_21_14_0_20_43_8]|nr:MAG: hypothetical protein COV93_06045 [Candidatus Woesearchaeota archaeon CG11_big_fil_rev_8_21_14_0_20_43_8]
MSIESKIFENVEFHQGLEGEITDFNSGPTPPQATMDSLYAAAQAAEAGHDVPNSPPYDAERYSGEYDAAIKSFELMAPASPPLMQTENNLPLGISQMEFLGIAKNTPSPPMIQVPQVNFEMINVHSDTWSAQIGVNSQPIEQTQFKPAYEPPLVDYRPQEPLVAPVMDSLPALDFKPETPKVDFMPDVKKIDKGMDFKPLIPASNGYLGASSFELPKPTSFDAPLIGVIGNSQNSIITEPIEHSKTQIFEPVVSSHLPKPMLENKKTNLYIDIESKKSTKIFSSTGGPPLLRIDREDHHKQPKNHLQYGKGISPLNGEGIVRNGDEAYDILADIYTKSKNLIKLPWEK